MEKIVNFLGELFDNFLMSPVKFLVKLSFLLLILTILLQALYFYSWPACRKDSFPNPLYKEKCPVSNIKSFLYGKAARDDCRKVIDRILPQNDEKTKKDTSLELTEEVSNEKYKGNSYCTKNSDIINHTNTILDNASLLVSIISFVVFLATLVFGFLGYKWLREYLKLKETSKQNKMNLLDSAKMTLISLPTLINSVQAIPDSFSKVLLHVKSIFDDVDLVKLIDKYSAYEELRFVYALYFISRNDHSSARDILITINEKPGISDDLKRRTRYRLGIEYRALKKYKEAIDTFKSIPDGNNGHKVLGKCVTEFVGLRLGELEGFEGYDKKDPFEEFKGSDKKDSTDSKEFRKLFKLYESFEKLTEKYKSNISIQYLGAELSAFVILTYECSFIERMKLLKLFVNSFKESSKLSEQQMGLSGDSNIECAWNYAYSLILAQAYLLERDMVTNNDKREVELREEIRRVIDGIVQGYDDERDERVPLKTLDHLKRATLLIPQTKTYFSEMRQCNVGKEKFLEEFKNFLKVLQEHVFNESKYKDKFKELERLVDKY